MDQSDSVKTVTNLQKKIRSGAVLKADGEDAEHVKMIVLLLKRKSDECLEMPTNSARASAALTAPARWDAWAHSKGIEAMTPTERYEYQRRNRQRLYAVMSAVVVVVCVLRVFQGAL